MHKKIPLYIIILLTCILPVMCQRGCIVLRNSLIEWRFIENGNLRLGYYEPEEFQWHAVGFNSLHGDIKNDSIIFMRVENRVHVYKGIGKDKQPEWIQSLNATIGTTDFQGYRYGIIFTVPMNNTIFEKKETIRIFAAGNSEEAPKSPTNFTMHTWTQIRETNLYDIGKFYLN